MADNDYIPPVPHSRMGRGGHTLGGAVEGGFNWGLIGGMIGFLSVPGLIGFAAMPSFAAIAAGASLWTPIAATVISAIALSTPFFPLTWGVAAIGAALTAPIGAWLGGKKAARITGEERAAYDFDAAYTARTAQLQGLAMAQFQQAQEAAYMPPPAAYQQPQPQMASAPVNFAAANSEICVPQQKPDMPMSKIAAGTIEQHQKLTPVEHAHAAQV